MKTINTLTMNPCLDVSAEIDRVEPTKKLRCRQPRREPGGGGINVARAVHILGGEATAYFTCGGVTGEMLQQMMDEYEIDYQPLHVAALSRESFAVRETGTGEQYRFVLPGEALEQDEWRRCLEISESRALSDYMVASGSLPPGVDDDFYARLSRDLSEKDTRLIIDTSGEPLRAVLETGVYMIKPNLRELSEATGRSLEDERDQEDACRELVDTGRCEMVILSLGHRGALLTDRDRQIRVAAFEVEVDSSIGAGDSFVAGVVYGLASGRDHEEAFYYGMAAGTAALVTPGTELCRRQDTEKFYRELQERQQ